MGQIKLPSASIEFFKSNLDAIFESGALAEGPWNRKLAELAASYCGARRAVPTSSNGSGLLALLQLLKETRGRSRVLLQSNTMYGVKTLARASGLELAGFVDCAPATLMPGLADVERALAADEDPRSLVVLLSHIGGIVNPDIAEIARRCREKGAALLEDCAHSYGATLNGRHSGTFGDAGVFSFYATKAIPAGEGGVAVTNDEELGAALERYVKYDRFERSLRVGVNVRPSEVQALLIHAVARETESIIRSKAETAAVYAQACRRLGIAFIPQDEGGARGNYYKFIVLAEGGDVAAELPLLQTVTSKVYDYCLGRTAVITKNHACLPIWYGQEPEVAARVVGELEACARARRAAPAERAGRR